MSLRVWVAFYNIQFSPGSGLFDLSFPIFRCRENFNVLVVNPTGAQKDEAEIWYW